MANKDGIVSIGFDYKKELDEVCATIEKELNNLGGDINLSDGIKKQMTEIKKMILDMKSEIGSSFDKISDIKLDTRTFESFKKEINKKIREMNKEITSLKEQFSLLDGSANVNNIISQFESLKKYIEDSNRSISELINNSERLGKSVVISSNINIDSLREDIDIIKKILSELNKNDLDFGYSKKSTGELSSELETLVGRYYHLTDSIDEVKTSMNGIDNTTEIYKAQEIALSKLSLELLKCAKQIDDLFGSKNSEKIDIEKIISIDELDDILEYTDKVSSKIKLEAKNIIDSFEQYNNAARSNNVDFSSGISKGSNIEVHISTKQTTLNKQLDEMIDSLQQRAANKPIIAPVKLRVDSEYENTSKSSSAPSLTENQINEARRDVESVIPGLDRAFNNSMRIATNKAVEMAKESIKAVREFFETNPITVHLTVPEDERLKIGKSILSEDGKTTIDISGQVDKARKSVKGLSEDLEKSQLLIKENAQNAKDLSLERLVNNLSETMAQFSELKSIITSIQNMENTIARASGISSTDEIVSQWTIVEKTIINATKLDGNFRKNANIGRIISEYQKYIDMGGTNSLFNIDKIKDNQTTIDSILSQIKEFKNQKVENDSIQQLSVDLDGVIAKFDELISTVKIATNALYKIIRQGSVSDLDKQWSSISNKFKSIADESGKINLSKQKTDIKELMDMYQKYTNAGGTNSLMSLTDNVETLRKLDKEYQKLNQTQTADNSSIIEKESESFDKVEKSVASLTTAIGDTKVQAINIEATAMEDAAEREIMAIRSILDNLDLIVSRLKDIKGIKLPKIEVKNAEVAESSSTSLGEEKKKIESVGDSAEETKKKIDDVVFKPNTEGFDEIVVKLDLAKERIEEIAKITKSSVWSESEGKYVESYNIRYKNGTSEIRGENSNKNGSNVLRANEVAYDTKVIERQEQALKRLNDELKRYKDQTPQKPINGEMSNYFEGIVQDYRDAITRAEKFIVDLGDSPITKDVQSQWETLIDIIEKAKREMDAVPKSLRGSDADARMKEIDKLSKYLDKNTRLAKDAKEQLEYYLGLLKNGGASVNVKEIHTEWTRVAVAEREAGREGKSFLDIFKNKIVYNYAAQLAGYYLSFMDLIRYTRNAISAVQELDTALVDLKKTTSMTSSELEQFYFDSNAVAKQMGVTTASIIEQASAWSRLGFSTKEQASQMAELSSQFASISPGMSTDDAQEGLVSIMKAWDISTDQVEREVMDNINILGNRFAETNQDIVEGMKRSAATFSALGQTWTDAFALFTGAQEVIQNAETVGTALKTLSLRIRGYSEDTGELDSELSNITGEVIDLTKTLSNQQGISLFTDASQQHYKSMVDYLGEISDIWDEIDEKSRTQLLEKLFGKRGASVGSAIIGNFDAVRSALMEMENAAGAADAEMGIIQESIDFKLNALKETWVGTAQAIIDRGDFGKVIDALTKLSEAIGWVIDNAGLLGTLAIGGGLFAGIKNVGVA